MRNALQYIIVDISSQQVTVRGVDDEEDAPTVVLSRKAFFHAMRLNYAMTYASCQGVTVEGLLALHDTGHRHFCSRKLYVGMSRARGMRHLVVY